MNNPPATPLSSKDLLADLRAAGINRGDSLIIHASFKSLGPVADGPATVVDALLNAVGPEGTLLMPTFADPQPNGEFHLATTPSRVGAVSEAFRTHAAAIRSHHPTHPVSATGARAAEFISGHENTSGLGVDSPFHRAALAGAKQMMIGCTFRAASIVHVAEAIAKVPYFGRVWFDGYERTLTMVFPDGRRKLVPPLNPSTCSAGFEVVQRAMVEQNLLRNVRIGHANCLLFNARDALNTALLMLRADPYALLCHRPHCPVCPRARTIQY